MLLKDLINQLQSLYDKEVVGDYLEVMREPEIMIDVFEKPKGLEKLTPSYYSYKGFDKEINIERLGDGVYLLISRFKD